MTKDTKLMIEIILVFTIGAIALVTAISLDSRVGELEKEYDSVIARQDSTLNAMSDTLNVIRLHFDQCEWVSHKEVKRPRRSPREFLTK